MSSVVINPTRRAENTIYLAFSTLAVVSIQYGFAKCHNIPDFQPDLLTTIVAGSLLAPFLMYPAFEKSMLKKLFGNRVVDDFGSMVDFPLFGMYILNAHQIVTQEIPNATRILTNKTQEILDGEELTAPMWKLRAAILFLSSIPFTAIIVCYFISDSFVLWTLSFYLIILIIAVVWPSYAEYERTSDTLSNLVQFHLFDELLTTVRRTELTPDYDRRLINLKIEGLATNLYASKKMGPRGTGAGKPPASLEAEKGRYPVTVSGSTEQQLDADREQKRKYNSLLAEECSLLRELNMLREWPRFNSRFNMLRGHIITLGQDRLNTLPNTIGQLWENALISGTQDGLYALQFNGMRHLLCQMKQHGFIPQELADFTNFVIEPRLKLLIDWSFSYHYYRDFKESIERINNLFRRYIHEKVRERGWEPTPTDEEAEYTIDKERMYQESWVQNQERSEFIKEHGKFRIFKDVNKDVISNPEKETYDYNC